jgi:RNA polymerase sigma-70 factor, ECF subfamily
MGTTFASRTVRSASVRDAALEGGFARRDADAYEAAYRSYGPRMYATALRLLRDPETAHECVHDVFLHLWRKTNAYATGRGSLEAFLVTCARNAALTQLRSSHRGSAASARLPVVIAYELEEDPIERERIARAIGELNDDQAEIIRRAYYGGMTLSEVAAELAIPVGTVKGRLSAALRLLRATLLPEYGNAE